jgi:hypothetical protein
MPRTVKYMTDFGNRPTVRMDIMKPKFSLILKIRALQNEMHEPR